MSVDTTGGRERGSDEDDITEGCEVHEASIPGMPPQPEFRTLLMRLPHDADIPSRNRSEQGNMEAAGIEPASHSRPNEPHSRDFTFKTEICGIDFEIVRDGKHLNLHLYEEGQVWRFEEIDQRLADKLSALAYYVSKLAQETRDE